MTMAAPKQGHQNQTQNTLQFEEALQSSQSSAPSEWWEIEAIIAEKATRSKVTWAGCDPKTEEPWPAEWVGAPGACWNQSYAN